MREAKPSDIWTLDRSDLFGTVEFLQNERIYPLDEEVVYNAIFDTVLAAAELFTKQRSVLRTLQDFGYTNPDAVLRNEEEFARLMHSIRFNKSKTKTLIDICNYCENESNVVQDIIKLGKKINRVVRREGTIDDRLSAEAYEFRDSLTDISGIGHKSATLLLLHLGAIKDMVVIDIWASRFGNQALRMDMQAHDYKEGHAPQGKKYLRLEEELNNRISSIEGFDLPSSIVMTSIWKKYRGDKRRKTRYERPHKIIAEESTKPLPHEPREMLGEPYVPPDTRQMILNSKLGGVDHILTQGFLEEAQRIRSVEQLLLPKRGWRNPVLNSNYRQERFTEPSPRVPAKRLGEAYTPPKLSEPLITDYV